MTRTRKYKWLARLFSFYKKDWNMYNFRQIFKKYFEKQTFLFRKMKICAKHNNCLSPANLVALNISKFCNHTSFFALKTHLKHLIRNDSVTRSRKSMTRTRESLTRTRILEYPLQIFGYITPGSSVSWWRLHRLCPSVVSKHVASNKSF